MPDDQHPRQNVNWAPYPDELFALVRDCTYRPGWLVRLFNALDRGQDSEGLTLVITIDTVNSYHPESPLRVQHLFPVPPAAYDRRSWQRWLFEQFQLVESHECAEFFQIDGKRPYAPHHYPGANPYTIFETGTFEQADTDFRGNRSARPSADAE